MTFYQSKAELTLGSVSFLLDDPAVSFESSESAISAWRLMPRSDPGRMAGSSTSMKREGGG